MRKILIKSIILIVFISVISFLTSLWKLYLDGALKRESTPASNIITSHHMLITNATQPDLVVPNISLTHQRIQRISVAEELTTQQTQQVTNPTNETLRSNTTFLINPNLDFYHTWDNDSCLSTKKINWQMVTFVKSKVTNIARREFLRRTWASFKYVEGGKFETIFIVGQSAGATQALLEEENKRNGDILQINGSDDYQNVYLKTLAGMQWASANLPPHYFYSTSDDDMLINLGKVQETIDYYKNNQTTNNFTVFPIICMYQTKVHSVPIRNPKHKNYVSKEKYKESFWPKFCLGGMYSTSVEVIRQLWQQSRKNEPLNTDDVWITGILRQQLGISDEMIVKSAAAKHLRNFIGKKSSNVRDFMQEEWEKYFNLFRHKNIYTCV